MTSNPANDLGPLFQWKSGKSGDSGTAGLREMTTESPTVPESPDRSGLNDPYSSSSESHVSPKTRAIPHGPANDGPPDFHSEILNDSGQDPRSGIHPLRGDTSPDFPAAPTRSSAALTLRSQRTDTGGAEPGAGPEISGAESVRLRPYQAAALEAIEREFAAGRRRTLLVLPTGTGKTVVFAEHARRHTEAHRTLVIAHRTELIDQAANKLRAVGLTVSIEQGDQRANSTSDAVVGSVATLRGARLARFERSAFGRIVIDEAHHAAAAGYQGILEHFETALVLGVTATPDRADGKPLGKVAGFESTAFTYELRQAIADGWLAPLRARRVRITDVDMSAIKAHHGDLDQTELSAVLREAKALQGVVGPLIQLAGARKSIVFGVDVAHAHALAAALNKHRQGSAIALDGSAPRAQRQAVLELFHEGTFQYLINCALFTEGFDEPSIECVALARPTMSRGLHTQMIGRGTRLFPGKRDCLILDFVGNTRHRLASPADALAGFMLPPELQAEVDAELESGKTAELELVLAGAQENCDKKLREKASLALAYYRTKEVDPFVGEFLAGYDLTSDAPATAEQLARLTESPPTGFGFSDPPAGLTKAHAQAIIDAAEERSRRGLASLPQIRVLRKVGIDARRCTKARASELFMKAKRTGYSLGNFRNEPEFDGRTSWK